jgi:hypothetical protein
MEEVHSEIRVIAFYRLRYVLDGGNVKWDGNPKHRQYNSLVFSICQKKRPESTAGKTRYVKSHSSGTIH